MKNWLQGRKTYFLAGAICLAAILLVFFHRVSPETAAGVVLFALGCFCATFRAVLQRHHDEVVAVLEDVAVAGADAEAHNATGALKAGEQAVMAGAKVDEEIKQEGGN